jgi:hypothetical protein
MGTLSMRAYRDGESYTIGWELPSISTLIANVLRLQLTRSTTSKSHSSVAWLIHSWIMNKQCRSLALWALRVIEIFAEEKRALFQYTPRLPLFNEFDGCSCCYYFCSYF